MVFSGQDICIVKAMTIIDYHRYPQSAKLWVTKSGSRWKAERKVSNVRSLFIFDNDYWHRIPVIYLINLELLTIIIVIIISQYILDKLGIVKPGSEKFSWVFLSVKIRHWWKNWRAHSEEIKIIINIIFWYDIMMYSFFTDLAALARAQTSWYPAASHTSLYIWLG